MVLNRKEEIKNKKLKVLLIDNDATTGALLKKLFKGCFCSEFIGQAFRGLQGATIINEQTPELVVIDLKIPGTSAFDLLTWVKETHSPIKVVMITDSPKQEYRMIAESLGADYFLDKQTELFRIMEIIKIIASAVPFNCDDDALSEMGSKQQIG